MGVNKLMTYGRYVLVVILIIYLLLVWMYFKDNAYLLNASGLFLWFVLIPLALFGLVFLIRWYQKKREDKATAEPDIQKKDRKLKKPNTYKLFIYSSICLPEGNNWDEIKNNKDDLTILSDNLIDFENLPLLIKPIIGINDEAPLPYTYIDNFHAENDSANNSDVKDDGLIDAGYGHSESDNSDENLQYDDLQHDDSRTEHSEEPDGLTLRLWALIYEQLTLSGDALSILAQHFDAIKQKDTYEPNSALHIHPEWQQHYIASADKDNSKEVTSSTPAIALTQLSVHLCIPALADSAFLTKVLKQQLVIYGIPEPLLIIKIIIADDTDDASAELYQPIQFINEQLITISKVPNPEVCLFIVADTQIDEKWLESQLYVDAPSNTVPTEASTLLIFYNKAAQAILNIDNEVGFLLTEISDASNNGIDSTNLNARQHYLNNLIKIKQLLLDSSFVLNALDDTQSQNTEKKRTESVDTSAVTSADNKMKTDAPLTEKNIISLSDINPAAQPYNLSLFMTFIDFFIDEGALVNEHHLGHYMSANSWLKTFISLSILVDTAFNNKQESDISFLITQHKHCCMLWLADSSEVH